MMRQKFWNLFGICICVLAVAPALSSATVTVKDYNFDGGWEGFVNGDPIVGYDGWAGTNGSAQMLNDDDFGAGTGFNLAAVGYTMCEANRPNDANWSYSIPAGTDKISLELEVVRGWTGWGMYTSAQFGLSAGGTPQFWFGVVPKGPAGKTSDYPYFGFIDGAGTPWLSATKYPGNGTAGIKRAKIDIDLTANGGAGSATMYADLGNGGGLNLLADLQDMNLGLTTAPNTWDGISVRVKSYTRLDNLRLIVGGYDPLPPIPGDANLDDVVNLADFTILKANYGVSPAEWTDGDFNDDDIVNLADFTIQKAHYGESRSTSSLLPEPATISVLALAAMGLLRKPRR